MGTAMRFEDLVAWQKARELTAAVYRASGGSAFSRDWALCTQVRRAAVSIMSNIAEGFERRASREFSYFLSIAKSSCAEVRSQLYVALDVGYLSREIFGLLLGQCEEVARILSGLRASVIRGRDT